MEKVYSCETDFACDRDAVKYLTGFCFDDCEFDRGTVNYRDLSHVKTYMGIELWYNFVADYYVFIGSDHNLF